MALRLPECQDSTAYPLPGLAAPEASVAGHSGGAATGFAGRAPGKHSTTNRAARAAARNGQYGQPSMK